MKTYGEFPLGRMAYEKYKFDHIHPRLCIISTCNLTVLRFIPALVSFQATAKNSRQNIQQFT